VFNEITQRILLELSQGKFCSGQHLGEQNGISRAAIGKHIKALQTLGLDIYSVTGKGYKLSEAMPLLNSDAIKSALSNVEVAPIIVETVVGSTNEVIKEKIKNGSLTGLNSGYTVFTEAQTAGRGRRGRTWVSPLGASLYFSTHWRFEQGISATMGLSLAVGIALAETLTELGVSNLGLKWPNDVYFNGKKLAGILIELESQGADSCDIVIGVGINTSLPNDIENQIDQPFTDLTATGITFDRNHLAARLLEKLWSVLSEFDRYGFKPMVERWNTYDCFVNQSVDLLVGQRTIRGVSKGVDQQGGIVIETNNELQVYFGGEISLRKASNEKNNS